MAGEGKNILRSRRRNGEASASSVVAFQRGSEFRQTDWAPLPPWEPFGEGALAQRKGATLTVQLSLGALIPKEG